MRQVVVADVADRSALHAFLAPPRPSAGDAEPEGTLRSQFGEGAERRVMIDE